MNKENETTNNSKPMAYDTLLGVVDWLITDNGYKQFKEKHEHPCTYKTLLQKRVESEQVCELNDRLSINIDVHEYDLGKSKYESYEVSIVAEKRGKWWKLSCYSLTRKEIANELKEVEETLIRLFNNA